MCDIAELERLGRNRRSEKNEVFLAFGLTVDQFSILYATKLIIVGKEVMVLGIQCKPEHYNTGKGYISPPHLYCQLQP